METYRRFFIGGGTISNIQYPARSIAERTWNWMSARNYVRAPIIGFAARIRGRKCESPTVTGG
jgi:hypothetical protein